MGPRSPYFSLGSEHGSSRNNKVLEQWIENNPGWLRTEAGTEEKGKDEDFGHMPGPLKSGLCVLLETKTSHFYTPAPVGMGAYKSKLSPDGPGIQH